MLYLLLNGLICICYLQLEYVDKQIEIETNERDARDKLYAFRKQVIDKNTFTKCKFFVMPRCL